MEFEHDLDYDALAQAYSLHRQVHPEVLSRLIQTAEIDASAQVLEVGCGTGNYITALAKLTECSSWGVEPSPQMLAKARDRAPNINFGLGQAERLDFPSNSFDLVYSVDVIHHVQDRAAYLREAHRTLKPGGMLCTVTDSAAIIRSRQPLSVYFPETVAVELQRYPAISVLHAMMADAGFGNLQQFTVEFAYPLSNIQQYQDKAFSCLHLITAADFARGIQRMERDLRVGPIPCVSRYLLLWGTK